MNLFVTDIDPVQCAIALDDKRVGKMLMECNQMMSVGIKYYDPAAESGWEDGPGLVTLGKTHMNHPVSIWVRETRANFLWCCHHAEALEVEFEHRFGKKHASGERTPYLRKFSTLIPYGSLTPFQNSAANHGLGIDFSEETNVTEAYRAYLAKRWATDKLEPKWTNRSEPSWRNQVYVR